VGKKGPLDADKHGNLTNEAVAEKNVPLSNSDSSCGLLNENGVNGEPLSKNQARKQAKTKDEHAKEAKNIQQKDEAK